MKGGVTLTMEEAKRYSVIRSLMEGKMVNKEASLALGLSVRQVQRVKSRVAEKEITGILHGNKGRSPGHTFSPEKRDRIIQLAEERYFDNINGFPHLAEMLEEEESILINRETLRLWLRPRKKKLKSG